MYCYYEGNTFIFLCPTHRHGFARSDSEYGPLIDLPDWSFAGKFKMDVMHFIRFIEMLAHQHYALGGEGANFPFY